MENKIQAATAAMQQAKQKKQPQTIQDYIVAMKDGIKAALPSVMTPERFTRIALSAVSGNPQLAKCSPQSFLGAMMTAAQLGLEPNTPLGQAYLIPYRNHGNLECQFQLGYKGMIDLAYRSGQVSIIQAHTVYENDRFVYELGLDPKLEHVPAKGERGDPAYYYAVFRTKDDGYGFSVMSIEEVRAHARKYSKSFNNGPWQTNFDEMAKKTVLKRALKYAPLKSEFAKAISSDETIKSNLSEDMSIIPDESIVDGEIVPETDPLTGEVMVDA